MCVFFKPDSDMDPNSSGEGVNSVSSSIKRGLSVDSAQEVKRFRTATGAISAVRARAHAICASFYRLYASFWEFIHLLSKLRMWAHSWERLCSTERNRMTRYSPKVFPWLPDMCFLYPLNTIRVLVMMVNYLQKGIKRNFEARKVIENVPMSV